ncbi:preprotein translocase subunit YajC [Thermospira aquatica]|uniref:Sec translocon accessory complex subunit YajC n=1 Tax=Thermospira aquatica TaxID=2828656 RepID=A0AAX3BEH1_9SPIR|nr:preprotein translocase subunit YajC [Thermospira aquatica]URA10156.1 preprotein translocase subunit YajC [Thermospira aquatica]
MWNWLWLQAQPAEGGGLSLLLMPLLLLVFMYVLIFLPERKRRKTLEKQIASMKQGDRVITNGGIVGTIEFIGDKTVYIKTADAKIEVRKDFIAAVITPELDKK